MPKDLIITMLTTIIAAVIAHQINHSDFIEAVAQKMGTFTRTIIKLAARFGLTLVILIFSLYTLLDFGLGHEPVGRWEILGAIYFALLGLEFLKFLLNDISDVRSGRRPL